MRKITQLLSFTAARERKSVHVYVEKTAGARAAYTGATVLFVYIFSALTRLRAKPFSWVMLHSTNVVIPVLLGSCALVQGQGKSPIVMPTPKETQRPVSLSTELADWRTLRSGNTVIDDFSVPIKPYLTQRHVHQPRLLNVQLLNMPVTHVLHELAHQANLDLQLHESLQGHVTLSVEDWTLDAIMLQIAKQMPLHWRIDNKVLHVWGRKSYSESYSVNYLNLDRTTRSRVGLATQVGTINALGDGAAAGASNSSQTALENTANHHFWTSLDNDLAGLVARKAHSEKASYTINRDAALVTLHAPPALHDVFRAYLVKLNDNAQRQVLIEATVVEVTLSNSFSAGIDWHLLAKDDNGLSAAQVLSGSTVVNSNSIGRVTAPNGLLSVVRETDIGGITATLNLLQQFGDVRILSKPRIIALNNQSSVLKVVDNRVYFTVNVERQRSEQKDEVITETEIHTVPIGLVMNVTPHINQSGSVMLNVRPTLSRIIGFVDDPNPELAVADVRNSVPEIQVREMESMLRVNSGEMAIIGGLMQELQEQNNRQIPAIGRLPLLGRLFQQKNNQTSKTELLIVLKPTVLPAYESAGYRSKAPAPN